MLLKTIIRAVALSLLLSFAGFGVRAQSLPIIPFKYFSQATTNSTLVSGAGQNVLKWIIATNTTTVAATLTYLKLYNKATAPTCGTDTPVMTIALLPNAANGNGQFAMGLDDTRFSLGIGFCLTALPADNDTTATTTGIIINLGYLWQ